MRIGICAKCSVLTAYHHHHHATKAHQPGKGIPLIRFYRYFEFRTSSQLPIQDLMNTRRNVEAEKLADCYSSRLEGLHILQYGRYLVGTTNETWINLQ
jgi:hypothetical protein